MAIKTFTTGEVLTASDTNTYLTNSGLVYVSSGSFSNAATVDVTGFTSTYKAYRVMFAPYRHSGSGAVVVTGTFRTSSAAATGFYFGAGWYVTYLATSGVTGARSTGADMVLGSVFDTARVTRTFMDVSDVGVSGFYPCVTGAFYDFSQAQNVTFGYELANGGNVIDRIRFACATNMTGNWRVYGYREP